LFLVTVQYNSVYEEGLAWYILWQVRRIFIRTCSLEICPNELRVSPLCTSYTISCGMSYKHFEWP